MKSTSVQRQSIHSINGAIGNELTSLSTCWGGGGGRGWGGRVPYQEALGLPVELGSLTSKGFMLKYTNVMLLNVPN